MPKTLLTLPAICFSLVWIRTWFLSCKVKCSIHAKIARKNVDKWVVWRLMYWSIDVKSNLMVDIVASIVLRHEQNSYRYCDVSDATELQTKGSFRVFLKSDVFITNIISIRGFSSVKHFMMLSLKMIHELFITKAASKSFFLFMSFYFFLTNNWYYMSIESDLWCKCSFC